MGVYDEYINEILVKYLQTPAAVKFLKAFEDTANEILADTESVRKEALISSASDDTLGYHFQNTYTLASPLETPAQARAYLSGLFDEIWKQNGSAEHLLKELMRFGIVHAKIWTWTDLVQSGIPSAFGGNYTKLSGLDPNSAVSYLPNGVAGGPGWTIEHRNEGPNHALTVSIDTPGKHIVVSLQTDGAGVAISTAKDVFLALDNDPIAKNIVFFTYGGTGLGTAVVSAQTPMSFAYYTYYIIDVYDGLTFDSFVHWNDPGIFWNDGTSVWDGLTPLAGNGFANLLREVIRRATPSTMSCRFLRSFVKGIANTVPIADQWEEDGDGNISDFYTTHY